MKLYIKKIITIFLCICMILGAVGCSKDDDSATEPSTVSDSTTKQAEQKQPDAPAASDAEPVATQPASQPDADVDPDSWVIYWYLCGSDLETKWGCATTDLTEMFAINLPENVKVVIQTGGSAE